MRIIGNTLHTLAAAAIIAAIWSPIGTWWQWLASALLLWLAGAIIHASTQLAKAGLDQPASADGTDTNGNPLSADSPGPYSAEEIAAQIEKRAAQRATLDDARPRYGRRA